VAGLFATGVLRIRISFLGSVLGGNVRFHKKLFRAAAMAGLVLVATLTATASSAGNDNMQLAAASPRKLPPAVNLILLENPAPTCTDNIKNGSETDIDCGGSCGDCADGKACSVAVDCLSSICNGNVCQVPACNDGVKNGTETDVDCGGSCGDCAIGKACSVAGDCVSFVCNLNVCRMETCNDAVKNGTETDVDCGGVCGGCAIGQACSGASDCMSSVCTNNVCIAP
jgi:hypothetical protein